MSTVFIWVPTGPVEHVESYCNPRYTLLLIDQNVSCTSPLTLIRSWTSYSAYTLLQVDEDAYKKLKECIFTSDINVCDDVPSGAKKNGAKLTNPLGGTAHQVTGADR